MIAAFETLIPVFLLIGLGFALHRFKVIPADLWSGIELMGYWVFFPALLFETLVRSNIAELPLTSIAFTMVATFCTMAFGLILARRPIMAWLQVDGPSYSSIFQCSTRWNGFIALPVLAKLHGSEGVALVAVIIGALVPLANVMAVIVVAQNANGASLTARQTTYVVFRNPFIWATALGLIFNLLHIPVYEPVLASLSMLGGAAIGAGLLMVGAGLNGAESFKPSQGVWLGTGLKLFGMPLLALFYASLFGVTGTALLACLVCASVPTAMSAYVLARQMGGDAPLVAATVTLQTLVSFISLPFIITIAESLK